MLNTTTSKRADHDKQAEEEVSLADIEEELEAFVVRRAASEPQKVPASTPKSTWQANLSYKTPILLRDLKRAKPVLAETKVFQLFAESIQFKKCLVYAQIVQRRQDNSTFYYNYTIDDGTATMSLGLPSNKKKLNQAWELLNEVQALRHTQTSNKKEMANCLFHLIGELKQKLDYSNLKIGTKILIEAMPSLFRNEISLTAWDVYVDDGLSRNMEITYKTKLINWYANKKQKSL